MTNEEAIKIINENRELYHSLGSFTSALDLAIKALEIVDIPHTKDYAIFKGQKLYLTQGHIDALLEYERSQAIKEVVESFTKPFNVDFPKDFFRGENKNGS